MRAMRTPAIERTSRRWAGEPAVPPTDLRGCEQGQVVITYVTDDGFSYSVIYDVIDKTKVPDWQ